MSDRRRLTSIERADLLALLGRHFQAAASNAAEDIPDKVADCQEDHCHHHECCRPDGVAAVQDFFRKLPASAFAVDELLTDIEDLLCQ